MISKSFYFQLCKKFKELKSAPKDKEGYGSTYELFCSVFDSEDELKATFDLWADNNDKWPTHLDLKKMLQPKIYKYNREQLISAKPESRPFFIWEWISNNLNVPKVDGFSFRVQTTAQLHDWNKTVNIAINTFYKQLEQGEIDYEYIVSGNYHEEITPVEDDGAFVDFKDPVVEKIEPVGVLEKPQSKSKFNSSQEEIDHRKSLPTYRLKPWLY